MGKERIEFVEKLRLLRSYFEDTRSPALSAYDVLVEGKYQEDSAYQVSLGFLSIANQSYLFAKAIYNENALWNDEIDKFFTTFEDYRFELKEYISDKDNNSSWLSSRKESFVKECNKSIEFITEHIIANNKLK